MRQGAIVSILLVFLFLLAAAPPRGAPRNEAPGVPPAAVARGKAGVVVSAHPAASGAGVSVLRAGGNALDAAIAAAYALAVVEPFSAGLGGGGFLLYFDARSGKATVFDYREVAPKRAHRDMYLVGGKVDPKMSIEGIRSVAVPGMVPGLDAAQRKLGRKRLRDVLGPAIDLARGGFLVTPRFLEASVEQLDLLRENGAASAAFLKEGQPYPVGERLIQRDLARTLKDLRREGPRLFTHGRIARAIATESARLGGLLTLEDLSSFRTREREALSADYRGLTVLTMPPPSSGGTHLLQMLGMLEIDRGRRTPTSSQPERAEDIHCLVEIMRRAYADRATFMGDPAFVRIPLTGLVDRAYLLARYETIDRARATPSSAIGAGEPRGDLGLTREPSHTTHITAIDREGNVAALTQTVNFSFGSGVVVPGTGVLLNNEMDDFSAAPGAPNVYGLVGGEANSIQPGKIPLSSMTPTIVLEGGRARLAVGAPGGSTIITTVLQIILNVIDRKLDVARAVAAPRIHMQWLPDELRYEPGALTEDEKVALEKRGHKLVEREPWGNATAIEVLPDGTRIGAADPRGDGGADAE